MSTIPQNFNFMDNKDLYIRFLQLYSIRKESILQDLRNENLDTYKWYFYTLGLATSRMSSQLNSNQIQTVLSEISSLSHPNISNIIKLTNLTFLKSLSAKRLDSESCFHISSIFTQLLNDPNPIIKQQSLETFDYFAHVTKHEQIIVKAIGRQISLQQEYKNYVLKITNKDMSLVEFLKLQLQESDNLEQVSKKLKIDYYAVINRIDKDVKFLVDNLSLDFDRLSVQNVNKLNGIVSCLNNLLEEKYKT